MSLWEILVPAEFGVLHNTIANPSFEYNNVNEYSQIKSFQFASNNGIKYWSSVNNAVISRSNDWASQGNYSLKIASGATNGSGVAYNPRSSIVSISGNNISVSIQNLTATTGFLTANKYYTFAIMGLDDIGMSLASNISDMQSNYATLNSPDDLWKAMPTIDGKRGHTDILFIPSTLLSSPSNYFKLNITDNLKSISASPKGYAIWYNISDNAINPEYNGTYTLACIVPNSYFSQTTSDISENSAITSVNIKKLVAYFPLTEVTNAKVNQNQYFSNRLYVSSELQNGTITWNSSTNVVNGSQTNFTINDVGKSLYSTDVTTAIGSITTTGNIVNCPSAFFTDSDVGRTLFNSNNQFIGVVARVISLSQLELIDYAAVELTNATAYWGFFIGIISNFVSNTQVTLETNPSTTQSIGKSFTMTNSKNLQPNYSVYCQSNQQYLFLGKIQRYIKETSEIEFYENVQSASNIVNQTIWITNETNPFSFPDNYIGGISIFTKTSLNYSPNYINLNCTAPYWGVTNSTFGDFTKSHHLYLDWCIDVENENPNITYNDTGALWSVFLYNNNTNQSTLIGTLDESTVTSQAAKRIGLRKKFLIPRPNGNSSDMSLRILYTGSTSDANLYIDGVQFVDAGMIWRSYDFYGSTATSYTTPLHFDDWDWDTVDFSYIDGDIPGATWADMMPLQSGTYQNSFPYFTNDGVWHSDAYEYGEITNANGYASPRFRKQVQWRNDSKPIYGVSIAGLSQSMMLTQSTTSGFWAQMTNENINVVVEPNTTGVGMPDIKTTSLEYGIVDGGFIQRQISQMRQMQFTIAISANSWKNLHANRRSLINLLKLDQLAQQGDRMLRYKGADTPVVTSVTYLDGLGYNGTSQNASFTEYMQLRFISSDPYFYTQTKINQKIINNAINYYDKSAIHYKIGNNTEWLPLNKHHIENDIVHGDSYFYNDDKTQSDAVNDLGWINSPNGNVSAIVVGGKFKFPFSNIAFFFVSGFAQKLTNVLPQNTSVMFNGKISASKTSRIVESDFNNDFDNVPSGSILISAGGFSSIGTVASYTKTSIQSLTFNGATNSNIITTTSGSLTQLVMDSLKGKGIWRLLNGSYTLVGVASNTQPNLNQIVLEANSKINLTTNSIAFGGGFNQTSIIIETLPPSTITNQYNCKYITLINKNVASVAGTVFGKQGFTIDGEIKKIYQDSPNSVIVTGTFSQVIESVENNDGLIISEINKNFTYLRGVYLATRMVRFLLNDTGRIIAESLDYIKSNTFFNTKSYLYSLLRYQQTQGDQSYQNAMINDVSDANNNEFFVATQSNILSPDASYDLFFPYQLTRSKNAFAIETPNSAVVYMDAEKNVSFVGIRTTLQETGTITYSNPIETDLFVITGTNTNFNNSWSGKSLFNIQGLYIGQIYFVESSTKLFLCEKPAFQFIDIPFEVTADVKNVIADKNFQKNVVYAILNSENKNNLWNTYVWVFVKSPLSISGISTLKGSRSVLGQSFNFVFGTDNKGTISTQLYSATVIGQNTYFTNNMVGNYIIARDGNNNYTVYVGKILSVVNTTTLILEETSTVVVSAGTPFIIRTSKYLTDTNGYKSLGGLILSNNETIAVTNFNADTTNTEYILNALSKETLFTEFYVITTLQNNAYNPFFHVDTYTNLFFNYTTLNYTSYLIRSFIGKNYHRFFNSIYANQYSIAKAFPEIPAYKGYTSIVDGALDTTLYSGAGTIDANLSINGTSLKFLSAAFSNADVGRSIYNSSREFIGVITYVTDSLNISITSAQASANTSQTYYLSGVSWQLGIGVISSITLTSGTPTSVKIIFARNTTLTGNNSLIGARIKRINTNEIIGIITAINHDANSQTVLYTVSKGANTFGITNLTNINEPYAISIPLYMYNFALKNTANATAGNQYSSQDLGMQTSDEHSGSYTTINIRIYSTSNYFAPNFVHFIQGAGIISTSITSRVVSGQQTNFTVQDIGKNIYTTGGDCIGRIAAVQPTASTYTVAILAENATVAVANIDYMIGLPYALYAYKNYMWYFIGEVRSITNVAITLMFSASEYLPDSTALSLIPYTAIQTSAHNYAQNTSNYFPYTVNDELYVEYSGKNEGGAVNLNANVEQMGNYYGYIGNIRNLFFATYNNASTAITASTATPTISNVLTTSTSISVNAGDIIFTSTGTFVGVVRDSSTSSTITLVTTANVSMSSNAFLRLAIPGKTTISVYPTIRYEQSGTFAQLTNTSYASKSNINSLVYTIAKTLTGNQDNNNFADGIGLMTAITQTTTSNAVVSHSFNDKLLKNVNDTADSIALPNLFVLSSITSPNITITTNVPQSYTSIQITTLAPVGSTNLVTTATNLFKIFDTNLPTSSNEPWAGRPIYNASNQYVGTIKTVMQTAQSTYQFVLEAPSLVQITANTNVNIQKTPIKYAIFPSDVIRTYDNQIIGMVKSVNLVTKTITLYGNATVAASKIKIQRGFGLGTSAGVITEISLINPTIKVTTSNNVLTVTNSVSLLETGANTITTSSTSKIVSANATSTFTASDVGKILYDANDNKIGIIASIISTQDVLLMDNALITITSQSYKKSKFEIGRSIFVLSNGKYVGNISDFTNNVMFLEENAKVQLTDQDISTGIKIIGPERTSPNCPYFSLIPITNIPINYPSENLTAIYVVYNNVNILLGYANALSFESDTTLNLYRANQNVLLFSKNSAGYSWGFQNEYNLQYLNTKQNYNLAPDEQFGIYSQNTPNNGIGYISTDVNSKTVTISQGKFYKTDVGNRLFFDQSGGVNIGTIAKYISDTEILLTDNARFTAKNTAFWYTRNDLNVTLPFVPGLGKISFMGNASGVANRKLSNRFNANYDRHLMKDTTWYPSIVRIASFFSGYTFEEVANNVTYNSTNITFTSGDLVAADVGCGLYAFDTNNNYYRLIGIIATIASATTGTLVETSGFANNTALKTYKSRLAGLQTNANAGVQIINTNNPARTIVDTNKKMYRADTYAFIGTLKRDSTLLYNSNAGAQTQFFLSDEPTQFTSQVAPGHMIVIFNNTYNELVRNNILYAGIVTRVIDNVNLDMKLVYANSKIFSSSDENYGFMNENYSYCIVPLPSQGFTYTPGNSGYVQNDWQSLGRQNGSVNTINSLNNGDILVGGEFTGWSDKNAIYNSTDNTVNSQRNVYGIAKITANTTNDGYVVDSYASPVIGTSYTANGVKGSVNAITDVSDINPINGYVGSADKLIIGGKFNQTMNNETLLPSLAMIDGSTLANSMRQATSVDFENFDQNSNTYATVKKIAATNRLRQYYQNPTTNVLDGINGINTVVLFDNAISPKTKMQYTTIRVRGNASTYPIITVSNTTSANKKLMALYQTETGAKIIFNNSALVIQPNETIIIDLRVGKRSIISNVRGNIISYVNPLSNFIDWILIGSNNAAGMNTQSTDDYHNNIIGVHADVELEISLAYTPRFWSFDANNLFFGTVKDGI
jgi:hypothetical protein